MKKLLLLALVGLFTTTNINTSYAAFPVKSEKAKTEVKQQAKSKEMTKVTTNANSEESMNTSTTAAAGGGNKSQLAAGLLCWFLGIFGVHDFYLGNTSKAFMKLGLTVLGILLMVIGVAGMTVGGSLPLLAIIGYLMLVGAAIWTLVDLIRIIIGNYPGL